MSWVEAANLEPGWYVSAWGPCLLTIDLGELTVPLIALDPERPLDPDSREVHLLVTEQGCNSGEDAQGRVEIVRVGEGDEKVELVLGVTPRGGAQFCPGHPATPFTVTLEEPLGERLLVDAGLWSQRPLNA